MGSHFKRYLRRGLLAGLLAGVAFGVFLALVGNPLSGYAEELGHGEPDVAEGDHEAEAAHEEAAHEEASHEEAGHEEAAHGEAGHEAAGHGEGGHDAAVSHAVTELVSLSGGVLWGILLGAAFGLAYFFLEPAIPGSRPARSLVLAGAGFVVASGAPWLALPPIPAGVEQALPTETRQLWYGVMMVAGAVACGAGGALYHRLRGVGTRRVLAAAAALLPLVALPLLALFAPANPTTTELPAVVAAAYRGHVIVGQVGLWLALGVAHAWFVAGDGPALASTDLGPGARRHPAD